MIHWIKTYNIFILIKWNKIKNNTKENNILFCFVSFESLIKNFLKNYTKHSFVVACYLSIRNKSNLLKEK